MIEPFDDLECNDLYLMYRKFNFTTNTKPKLISKKVLEDRVQHLLEELTELQDAVNVLDIYDIADALVDIVVLAKGTAVMMGLPWRQLWSEVDRANSSKVPGVNPKRPDHGHDLVKPPGWLGPQVIDVIDSYAN